MSDLIDWESAALTVARNQVGPRLPAEELLLQLGLTPREFEGLITDDLFRRKVKEYAKELQENGTSFVLKARVQAEELLKTNFKLARHSETPPSVAVAAIANAVRWAGYDKKVGGEADDAGNRPKISINISLAPPREGRDPVTITQLPDPAS